MINTLFDYFKSKGQALPSVSQRATTYGLGSGYSGTAEQNNALLARLQGGQQAQAPATPATPAPAFATPPQTATPAPEPVTPAPATPPTDEYLKKYLETLTPTADETATQDQLTTLEGSTRQGVAGLEGRGLGIPLTLVRGQQAQLQKQGELGQQTLRQKLANLQSTRKSAIDVSKVVLDRADSAAKTASDRLYEEQKLAKAAAEKDNTPYTLSQGQTRYDSKGNELSTVAPKPVAPKKTPVPTTVPVSTINLGRQKLDATKGEDGYVDPNVYQQAYTDWVNNKVGTAKEFLAQFPPATYVNPANTFLPTYLMPPKKKGSEVVNPFK